MNKHRVCHWGCVSLWLGLSAFGQILTDRMATEVDSTVGRVLAELKTRGLMENTLVIFTTDNSYFHGEHGLADKWYPDEASIRRRRRARWNAGARFVDAAPGPG